MKYDVKENGEIWSISHNRPLCVHKCKKGYCRVNLKAEGGTRLVHRLVAKKFIPNPDNLPQVNHKDGDKSNNQASNLEWVTGKQNVDHSVTTGLIKRGYDRPNSKLTDDQVREIRSLKVKGNTYYKIADMFGISYQGVHKVCKGQTYSHVK